MKIKLQSLSLMAVLMIVSAGVSKANNLQISGLSQTANTVTFTIQWDNSWYASTAPGNYDAAWVFVKSEDCSNFVWSHVLLSTGSGSVTGGTANLQADGVADGRGVFIHRAVPGASGTVSGTVTLTFASSISTSIPLQVFGIEMVYIPQGTNTVGDGYATNSFTPYSISSESSLTQANIGGNTPSGGVPAAFPKGFKAIYCMKYEITQDQYVYFLNSLTYDQQAIYTSVAPNLPPYSWALGGYNRNSIKIKTQGNATTTPKNPAVYGCDGGGATAAVGPNNIFNEAFDGQNAAENFMSTNDLYAYLDWAALRPMTELEFEKICRGGIGSWPNEYVWGNNTNITPVTVYQSTTYGGINEVPNTGMGSNGICAISSNNYGCNYGNNGWMEGPFRVGFSATSSTTRVTAGAAYFGVMEMAGNVWEQVISTYSTLTTSPFTGAVGTGDITTIPTDWTQTGVRCYQKGAGWDSQTAFAQTSNRNYYTWNGISNNVNSRTCDSGGRGVR